MYVGTRMPRQSGAGLGIASGCGKLLKCGSTLLQPVGSATFQQLAGGLQRVCDAGSRYYKGVLVLSTEQKDLCWLGGGDVVDNLSHVMKSGGKL
jgi:hypothetical protein